MEQLRIPIFTEKRDMKDFARQHRMAGRRLGLVGTMGAVHAGESKHRDCCNVFDMHHLVRRTKAL
jgi:hypothetical protein